MGGGGQDGCERRIEVFVKIQKKKWGNIGGRCRVWGGGVRVDVNEELKFLRNSNKKIVGGQVGGVVFEGGGSGGCERNVGGRGCCGVWGM